jgi:nuclear factor related to kappa-B-binding protein
MAKKPTLTIKRYPPEQVAIYHKQEMERYCCPDQPFMFNIGNTKSVVAPLKRIIQQTGNNKAREHHLLRDNRPSYVTLLTLVRDAASRLPGGVGTKADVALLLKDSQYIVQDQPDEKYRDAVGGTLDRLRQEEDPCVQYDTTQNLWVYLHRNRRLRDLK